MWRHVEAMICALKCCFVLLRTLMSSCVPSQESRHNNCQVSGGPTKGEGIGEGISVRERAERENLKQEKANYLKCATGRASCEVGLLI